MSHGDVDERHHVRVVEDGGRGGAGEHVLQELEGGVRRLRLVREDAHGVICQAGEQSHCHSRECWASRRGRGRRGHGTAKRPRAGAGVLTPSVQEQQQLLGEDLDVGVFAQGGHDHVLVWG